MVWFGEIINWSTAQQPFIMGILVAVLMGWALTAPISSLAIAIMLSLDGLAAGAATIGCAAQMMGFATASYRENGRSEEHTSELQSRGHLVCRLLLEK